MLTFVVFVWVPSVQETVHVSGVVSGSGIWKTYNPDVPCAVNVIVPFVAVHVEPAGYVTAIYAHAAVATPPPTFILPTIFSPHGAMTTTVGIVNASVFDFPQM